eukprot:5447697-Amphidinium_carterae.1
MAAFQKRINDICMGCRSRDAGSVKQRKRLDAVPSEELTIQEARFRTGTVIVANNISRCQINKDRAKQYTEQADTPLRWSVVRDVPTLKVLQNQDCNAQVKGGVLASILAFLASSSIPPLGQGVHFHWV